MRDDLHIYSLTRTFREKEGRTLPIIALWFFVVAVLLTFVLGFAITSKDLIIGSGPGQVPADSTGRLFIAFLMTGCLIMVFSFFALASGLMAVHEFGVYADEHTPDPIYLNEQLMLDVVLRAVKEQIGDEDPLSLSEMRRTPDAGLTLLLHERGSLQTLEGESLLEEKGWLVEADLWARLRQVVEHNRAVKVEKPKS
jgi:hypothetical protein